MKIGGCLPWLCRSKATTGSEEPELIREVARFLVSLIDPPAGVITWSSL
jgi:hypothetical protein